jgi:effector-binding domain-containing protein
VGLRPAGREIVMYHSVSLTDDDLDVEVCQPLEDAGGAPPAGCRRLPGGPHAVTIHKGPWLDIRTSYCSLFVWMADHGLRPGTPQRERYLADERETADRDDFVTEIAWPIEQGETQPGRRAALPRG